MTFSKATYTDDYGRNWQGPYPFTPTAITAHAPNAFGVYQVIYVDASGDHLAYIGIATGDTIRGRLTKHVTGSGNWALARLGDPTMFRFVYYECDARSAKQIESHVITTEKPPFINRKQITTHVTGPCLAKPEYKHFIPSISVH